MVTLNKKTVYLIGTGFFIAVAGFLYVSFFAAERPAAELMVLSQELDRETINAEETGVLTHTVQAHNREERVTEEILAEEISAEMPIEPMYAIVFISGEVYQPGVFQLVTGARVIDAVERAGGVTAAADLNRINLAAVVFDEQHIIVPSFYDDIPEPNQPVEELAVTATSLLININTADEQALQTLPGIGPVISGHIVNHRMIHGDFTTIEQIQNVNRIGPNVFAGIRERITVN